VPSTSKYFNPYSATYSDLVPLPTNYEWNFGWKRPAENLSPNETHMIRSNDSS